MNNNKLNKEIEINSKFEVILQKLQLTFHASDIRHQRQDLTYITVSKEMLEMTLIYLRDHAGYGHLSFFTTVDYVEQNLFKLTYMLYNYKLKRNIAVQVDLDRNYPVMESIHHLWEQAATYQRELKEMFGIDFPGSPGVDDNFFLEGWDGPPPMRKEFDTKTYSTETYFPREGRSTHDPAEYMKQQLYPDGGV